MLRNISVELQKKAYDSLSPKFVLGPRCCVLTKIVMMECTLSHENSAFKVTVEALDPEAAIFFLQTCESMCTPLETGDLPSVVVNPEASFEPVRDVILDLREKVEDLCNQELSKITKQGLSQVLFYRHFILISYLFFHRVVFSLPVNDTTMFTLGDGKFQTFFFISNMRVTIVVLNLPA